MNNGVFEKIKKNKKIQYILITILTLIIVVFVFISLNGDKSDSSTTDAVNLYVTGLEDRLIETLSRVRGVGNVSVVITVESGMETVLAMKTTTNETSNGKEIIETPIIVNGKTVVLKENYPKIVGVLIVAKGADSISVLNKIQQATVSLLNINVNQIEILTMK